MSPRRVHQAAAFCSAIEAQDFSRAEAALRDYLTWFMSTSRSLQEIDSARNLLKWSIDLTSGHRTHMAEELMSFRRVLDAYLPPRRTQTWRVVG
jgi:hypothetical protein